MLKISYPNALEIIDDKHLHYHNPSGPARMFRYPRKQIEWWLNGECIQIELDNEELFNYWWEQLHEPL